MVRALVLVLGSLVAGAGAGAGCGGDAAGEDPPAREPLGPALLAAAERGTAADVRELVRRGAPVGVRDARRRTPLAHAAYRNEIEAARVLVGAGADVNAKDETQQSPYLIATSEVGDDPALLDLALASGARIDDKDSYDGTGLIRAADRGYPRIVRRLLAAGIDRDHVNRLGWTALLEAVVLGDGGPPHIETVRALVHGGVDVDLPDAGGVTPLAHAEERGHRAIARLLREAGARRGGG